MLTTGPAVTATRKEERNTAEETVEIMQGTIEVGEKITAQIDMKEKDIVHVLGPGPERPLGGNARFHVHAAEIGKHEIVEAIADGADHPMTPDIIETINDMNVTTEDDNTTQI